MHALLHASKGNGANIPQLGRGYIICMGTSIVNDACLWRALPLHRACLPTWGQHALHNGPALHVLLLFVFVLMVLLHIYYNRVQRQMPWLKH